MKFKLSWVLDGVIPISGKLSYPLYKVRVTFSLIVIGWFYTPGEFESHLFEVDYFTWIVTIYYGSLGNVGICLGPKYR